MCLDEFVLIELYIPIIPEYAAHWYQSEYEHVSPIYISDLEPIDDESE